MIREQLEEVKSLLRGQIFTKEDVREIVEILREGFHDRLDPKYITLADPILTEGG